MATKKKHMCPDCIGTRRIPATINRPCPTCKGRGVVNFKEVIVERTQKDCLHCQGKGKYDLQCPKCKGSGRFVRGGKDYGICYDCKGKGEWKDYKCSVCGGRGYWTKVKRERVYDQE